MFFWLRRIPAETRIVVLVVFLALFQAILLSLFGLRAIRNEREDVAENLGNQAQRFLVEDLVQNCQFRVTDAANEAAVEAFEQHNPEWRTFGGGLFTDAFLRRHDGRIEDLDEKALWLPQPIVAGLREAEREASAQLRRETRGHEYSEAHKAELNLEFARSCPFLVDELGRSLALLHAATPLYLGGEEGPDVETLLKMRWVGVVNRVAGYVEEQEIERFLARVDAAGGERPGYSARRAEQEARAYLLANLVRESPVFRQTGPRGLHENVHADTNFCFYLRPTGSQGDVQVLTIDRGRLDSFLANIAMGARGRAPEGVRPSIVPEVDASTAAKKERMEALPGYVAAADISAQTVLAQAAERERFYWYIIGFSVAGILAGGLLTARAVMREMKLAKLKAGFVSNVSHGLKTPLTSIRMFSEMLRDGQVTDEAERAQCLDVIAQETERLGQLIQQVLDFGRLEARKRPFHWATGPLEPVVRRETERFRRATGLTEDELEVSIAVNLPPVTYDAQAFREVVANLLSNAYKYTKPNDRRIEVTLGPQRGRAVLAVEDNGPGIAPGERRKIFEQFYRSDDLLTREVEGTGLGLSIARNIVNAHGGRILVEDGSDGGSRFLVILPAAPRQAASRAPAEAHR